MKQSKRRNKTRSYSISGIHEEIAKKMRAVGAHKYMVVFTADNNGGEPAFFFGGPSPLEMMAWMNSVENRVLKAVIDGKTEDPDMELIVKAALLKLDKAHGDFFKAVSAYEKGRGQRHINP
jgi:hypothetical protein